MVCARGSLTLCALPLPSCRTVPSTSARRARQSRLRRPWSGRATQTSSRRWPAPPHACRVDRHAGSVVVFPYARRGRTPLSAASARAANRVQAQCPRRRWSSVSLRVAGAHVERLQARDDALAPRCWHAVANVQLGYALRLRVRARRRGGGPPQRPELTRKVSGVPWCTSAVTRECWRRVHPPQ